MKISEMRVLVCDDSILVRKRLKDVLQLKGITTIYEAADGFQAVELFEKNRPDVTFMDIVMPKKTGIEALREILAHDPNAKVIMASTVGTQNFLVEAIKTGAADFLQKPVKEESVFKVLEKIAEGTGD